MMMLNTGTYTLATTSSLGKNMIVVGFIVGAGVFYQNQRYREYKVYIVVMIMLVKLKKRYSKT